MYTIKLYDGTVLDNLILNGNNFISDKIIPDDIFTDNLNEVEISDGENTQIYQDMALVANRVIDGKSWFILAEKTPEQKEKEEFENNIADIYATLISKGLKQTKDLPDKLQLKVSKIIDKKNKVENKQ